MPDTVNHIFDLDETEDDLLDLGGEYQDGLLEGASQVEKPEQPEQRQEGAKSLYEIPEHVLLKDPRSLPPSRAVRITAVFETLGNDGSNPKAMSDILAVFEKHVVVDYDGYLKMYREKGLRAVFDLLAAWAGELVGDYR